MFSLQTHAHGSGYLSESSGPSITVNQGSQEWEVLLPAPIAALRLSFEQPRAEPVADHLPTLFAEFEWIADAIALHYEVRPSLFLWRQWMADEFLRGGHSTLAPMGIGLVEKSEMLKDTAGVVQAYGAIRKLVLSGKQANVPLAIRRLGLTRTRIVSEDVPDRHHDRARSPAALGRGTRRIGLAYVAAGGSMERATGRERARGF